MPLFSVIIPVYNREKLLASAIDSVLAQAFDDREILVVDDGSTDGSMDLVERRYGSQVKVYRQANAGPGMARNFGAAHATGEYLAFLDSDDLWFPWTLATYARLIAEYDRPAVLSGAMQYFTDESDLPAQPGGGPPRAERFEDYFASSRAGLYVGAGQGVFRRDVFEAAGGFVADRLIAEDHDLMLRLGTARGLVVLHSPPTVGYRQHAGSVTAADPRGWYLGVRRLVEREQAGDYAGGADRRRERLRILTARVRSAAVDCVRQGRPGWGWWLYKASFRWNLLLGRWRFLLGFPLQALAARVRS
jgi:glycosyltransferase involved in cell wall biosynthesis